MADNFAILVINQDFGRHPAKIFNLNPESGVKIANAPCPSYPCKAAKKASGRLR
jgi:hypothetical protein